MSTDHDVSPSLVEHMAARLRAMIAGGELVPGQKLSETKLAAELDISRNTLREVFRLLTRERLLRHRPNRGVFVTEPSLATILDIYRVRRLVEVPALAQAWPGHEAVARMRLAVEEAARMARHADWKAVGSANMDFHAAIVALTDSPRLIAFFAQISAELRLSFGLLDNPGVLHQPYIDLNRTIVERLEDGDPKGAAEALDDYLTKSERTFMTAFARLGPEPR